jgi:arsenate reductase
MSLFEDLQTRRARVLFVCLGNSARSQMAEAMARDVASDVLEPESAGIKPAARISKRAVAALKEKGIEIDPTRAPKDVSALDLTSFDVIVNLCDYKIPNAGTILSKTLVLNVKIADPMGLGEPAYVEARDRVEEMIGFLGEHFRRAKDWAYPAASESTSRQTTALPPPLPPPLPDAAIPAAF